MYPCRHPTMFWPCQFLFPGMRGDGFQLSGVSGTPPLSDATVPDLLWAPTSPNRMGTLTLDSQGTRQRHLNPGGRRSRPRWRRPLGLAPLTIDPSSGRPTTFSLTRRYTGLWQAPSFLLHPPLGIRPSSRWRKKPLALRSFLPPLEENSHRS